MSDWIVALTSGARTFDSETCAAVSRISNACSLLDLIGVTQSREEATNMAGLAMPISKLCSTPQCHCMHAELTWLHLLHAGAWLTQLTRA